jgi:hypothetical protein
LLGIFEKRLVSIGNPFEEADMTKDLLVMLEDKPGTLAHLGETLGKAGVNIEGVCGAAGEGEAMLHILVDDAAAARSALDAAMIHIHDQRDVLVLQAQDRPGELGRLCRKIAEAGVNINLAYLATNTRLVLGVDDLEKARAASGM